MFDYIIVASRLTEDRACRVLLLEAGGEDDSPWIRTPAWYGLLQDSPYDWADRTIPQAHLKGRRIFVPQGRVLGGSSAINYMIYIRGNRGDYDQWCHSGNEGWAYEDVLPYFVKAEGNRTISRSAPQGTTAFMPSCSMPNSRRQHLSRVGRLDGGVSLRGHISTCGGSSP
jgi:choline dehydrogenase-like flavoprotein